jgi:hypothetical protein
MDATIQLTMAPSPGQAGGGKEPSLVGGRHPYGAWPQGTKRPSRGFAWICAYGMLHATQQDRRPEGGRREKGPMGPAPGMNIGGEP